MELSSIDGKSGWLNREKTDEDMYLRGVIRQIACLEGIKKCSLPCKSRYARSMLIIPWRFVVKALSGLSNFEH